MLNSKLPGVKTSIFTIMSKMAQEYNAINLSQGFPDFKSDSALIDLVSKAMKDGYKQYAPMAGDKRLREAVSTKVLSLYGKYYCPEQEICITAGATQAIFTALATLINKHDEVIIFTPAYDCYEPTIRLFGGTTIPIQLTPPNFKIDWEEVKTKISNKTKCIIVNTPHNPSGTILSEDDMLQLEILTKKHNLFVLSDEVYEHIIFDANKHHGAAKFSVLSKRTFIIASFGKTFHNTGWKVGYCLAPKELMTEFKKIHQYNVFCVNNPVQKALATYIETPTNYKSLPDFYQEKRDFFIKQMNGSKFKIVPSKGTYFQLLDFSNISDMNDVLFAKELTKKHGVATIPTSVFNTNNEDFKQLRVCFAKEEETLMEASHILRTL